MYKMQTEMTKHESEADGKEEEHVRNGYVNVTEYDPDVRYKDGSLKLRNPNIERMDQDNLYHLALGSGSHDLLKMFGDVKFVCMGGTGKRMELFAKYMMKELDYQLPSGATLFDISQHSYRYSMYKVGPVLSISHGMGFPSLQILFNEVIKLMYHAKVRDPIFIRIGTSGGVGIEPGTVVISEKAVNGQLEPFFDMFVLDKLVRLPAKIEKHIVNDLMAVTRPDDQFKTVMGTSMAASDFYEAQGRLDGAFCDYTEQDKFNYLHKLQKAGVANIEMEATAFAALTHRAGISSAILNVTFLDRLKGDQVTTPKDVLSEWQMRPQQLVARYIKKCIQENGHSNK